MFTGYHATDWDSYKEIDSRWDLQPSTEPSEWLGDGIYFFENDPEAANWWIEVNDILEPVIVKAVILVDSDDILDLMKQKHYERLHEFQTKAIERVDALGRTVPEQNLDATAINLLCEYYPNIKVVRAFFGWEKGTHEKSDIYKGHVQLAVREHTCIKHFVQHGAVKEGD